jgi:hypothetical protein
MNFTSDTKFSAQKTDFWDPKLFINTASSISCCCSWPEWTCTHTSTPWRMNDKWSGINFLLGFQFPN